MWVSKWHEVAEKNPKSRFALWNHLRPSEIKTERRMWEAMCKVCSSLYGIFCGVCFFRSLTRCQKTNCDCPHSVWMLSFLLQWVGMKVLWCGHCDLGLLRNEIDAELWIDERQCHVDGMWCLSGYGTALMSWSSDLSGVRSSLLNLVPLKISSSCCSRELFFAIKVFLGSKPTSSFLWISFELELLPMWSFCACSLCVYVSFLKVPSCPVRYIGYDKLQLGVNVCIVSETVLYSQLAPGVSRFWICGWSPDPLRPWPGLYSVTVNYYKAKILNK